MSLQLPQLRDDLRFEIGNLPLDSSNDMWLVAETVQGMVLLCELCVQRRQKAAGG